MELETNQAHPVGPSTPTTPLQANGSASTLKWDGDRIRVLRIRLGWSQADMARRLGCRQQTVSEWETNVYQPQNAYSKLLDMMLNDVETYNRRINEQPLTELVMKDRGIAQVRSEDLFSSHPSSQMPQFK